MIMKSWLTVILLFLFISTKAQENNYWFHNFGSGSFLKGGVEVAGISNTSAIFYNPAALAHLEGEFFEAQADVISLDVLDIENGAGTGIPISYTQLDASPSLFAYKRHFNESPKWVYGIGLITKAHSNVTFSVSEAFEKDILDPIGSSDVFSGDYSYYNRIRENWLIGSISHQTNDHFAFGMSTVINLRIQDYQKRYNALAVPKAEFDQGNVAFSKSAFVLNAEDLTFRGIGFILKPAVNIRYEKVRFGMTLTTPNLNLGLLRNSSSRTYNSSLPDVNQSNVHLTGFNDFYAAKFKTPWVVDIGGEFDVEKWSFAISAIWYSKVDRYEMISKTDKAQSFSFAPQVDSKFAIPVMANKSIVNVGVAVVKQVNDKLAIAGSFRTDFNYLDNQEISMEEDFVPTFSYWDIYHFTAGIYWGGKRTNISLGLNYGFNRSFGDKQIINMTDANQQNGLSGDRLNTANTAYNNIGLVVGFYYSIDRLAGLNKKPI